MVSELCATPPMTGKPLPGKDDEPLLPLMPGNGGGPSPPLSGKGGGPPPPPSKFMGKKKATTNLKRSTEMGNLFRLLRGLMEGSCLGEGSSRGRKTGGGSNGGSNGGQSMNDALVEIARRSTYFQQIEEDVRTHDKTIKGIQSSLSSFKTKDMDVLLMFYQEVESKLDVLTDESQVLARFEGFPGKKLDALRMAAVLYKKLSATLSELHNWKIESPLAQLLDKVEKYFNKIKGEMEAIERTKDEEEKKFQSHGIHLDFNIILKIKEAMVNVSSSCIELALKEKREAKTEINDQTLAKARNQHKKIDTETLWRTFQFSFKVYSFAGGQDERAERLAKELAKEIQADP
ncbi:uncharacterized protein At4g04980-like [Chenopodium quinoa]|uniref:uncharacterized protein At4g04980-like n=1 Tax=Chenopodium quinoa TaxID=63459 RepID=UPI000B77506A|nr:uncharacterized protein At4g04980-like [Chenopodium quinoa]